MTKLTEDELQSWAATKLRMLVARLRVLIHRGLLL